MGPRIIQGAAIALVSLGAAAGTAQADTTIRTRMSVDQQTTESTVYTQKERQRVDSGQTAIIQRPDQKRTIQLNLANKTYLVLSVDGHAADGHAAEGAAREAAKGETKKGGVIDIQTSITDTGERKQMFGYEARHLKMDIRQQASADACNPANFRMESDGWYIDFKPQAQKSLADGGMAAAAAPSCKDEIRARTTGSGEPGFPVECIMKSWDGVNAEPFITNLKVLELSSAALNPALFEIPVGFEEQNFAAAGVGAGPVATAKRAGTVRVAVMQIADKTGQKSGITPLSNRQLAGMLKEEGLDAIASDSEAAAKQAGADYLLYTDVEEMKQPNNTAAQTVAKAGRFGGLVRGMAKMAPMAAVASSAAGTVGGNPEARMDYKLVPVAGGEPLMESVKGSAGGGFSMQNAMGIMPGAVGMGMMGNSGTVVTAMATMMPMSGIMPGQVSEASMSVSQGGESTAVLAAFVNEAKAVAEFLKK